MTEFRTKERRKYQLPVFGLPQPWYLKGSNSAEILSDEARSRRHWFDPGDKASTKLLASLVFDRRLREETARARTAILGLQDNWDGQGSPGYADSTIDKAISFLNIHVKHVFADSRRILIPKILPSDSGSIDLHWREQKFELLVNVPATDDIVVSFYAENLLDRSFIKGSFAHSSTSKLLANWLTEVSE